MRGRFYLTGCLQDFVSSRPLEHSKRTMSEGNQRGRSRHKTANSGYCFASISAGSLTATVVLIRRIKWPCGAYESRPTNGQSNERQDRRGCKSETRVSLGVLTSLFCQLTAPQLTSSQGITVLLLDVVDPQVAILRPAYVWT